MPQILALLVMFEGASAPPLTAPEIVDRMMQADTKRLAAFLGYTGMRRYRLENRRFNKRAEMTVRVTCDRTGAKTFDVVAESGSGFVRNRVFRKMIDAEREASEKSEYEQTRIVPANYDFRLVGTELSDGRASYVLEVEPKTSNRFLVCGRIWVDTEDFAITRIEGSPAKDPSFWVHSVQVIHRYDRTGRFWLPATNYSTAEAKVVGTTEITIEYFDYTIRAAQQLGSQATEKEWTR
ncbi:MAG: hypothetical protein LLG20_15985 [Acidobacteriales bacterium]|nr:hypothetical protein [Terriglobales bacterium]